MAGVCCCSLAGTAACIECPNRTIPISFVELVSGTLEEGHMDKSQEQELRDKIKELEDQLDMVKREHAFDDVATQMFAMKQAFMKVGFTEEQAQEFVMLNMKAGLR